MKIYKNPHRSLWANILKRPAIDTSTLFGTVGEILKNVKQNGDAAVRDYALKFDKSDTTDFLVTEKEFQDADNQLDTSLKNAILTAKANIERFHNTPKTAIEVVETMTGIDCWRKSVGIERVGLYIPGGTAPLFSTVLMLGVPAKIAGCREVVLCTPSQRNAPIHPAILFAAKAVGIAAVLMYGDVTRAHFAFSHHPTVAVAQVATDVVFHVGRKHALF